MYDPDRVARELRIRRRVLRGDADAWADLHQSSFRALYAYVYSRVGRDRERAEDVVQESWMIAVKRMRTFAPKRGPFEAWVQGIAGNVIHERRRRWSRLRRESESTSDPVDPRSEGSGDFDEEGLHLALSTLPEHYRMILRARYQSDEPVAAIAARLESTPKAVESLLARARQALADALAKRDGKTHAPH